jgi:hypothetical protein
MFLITVKSSLNFQYYMKIVRRVCVNAVNRSFTTFVFFNGLEQARLIIKPIGTHTNHGKSH